MSMRRRGLVALRLIHVLALAQVAGQAQGVEGAAARPEEPWQPHSVYEANVDRSRDEVAEIRAHLGRVLERLAARDVATLSREQRDRRQEHIRRLAAYRDQGIFPHNEHRPGLSPVFIDHGGRACAVGYLMIESGARELAERIARTQNLAYVPEITVPGVAEWIGASGLSAEECALIQPSYGGGWWYGLRILQVQLFGILATPQTGEAPLTVGFFGYSRIPATFEWDFGDGGTSTEQHPIHTYTAPGNYTVTLTVHCAFGTLRDRRVDFIRVRALTTDFTATPRGGGAPLDVAFTDLTSNEPTDWSWSFGDGTTSSEQNPTHTYASSGYYTVSLTASNALGSHTATRHGYIVVQPLQANFFAQVRTGYTPLTVAFRDTSSGYPSAWLWDFGDGSTSSEQHPSHAYVAPGTYTVSLTASTTVATDTETKTGYVQVLPMSASFTGTPRSGYEPLVVAFTDASTSSPTRWSWDFGDGGTSTLRHPSHTYESAGLFTVTLTASNAWESATQTRIAYVVVRERAAEVHERLRLVADDAGEGDEAGGAVAIHGSTAMVGASRDDHAAGTDAGSVYEFVDHGDAWREQARLTASDGEAQDFFGNSLALVGDTLVVGAKGEGHDGLSDAGAAYVFERDTTGWIERAKLGASDAAQADRFGSALALSGDTLLVGANGLDQPPFFDLGGAYVFVRDGAGWTQQAKLTGSVAQWSKLGSTVALSGDTAVLGSRGDGALVFVRQGTSWSQQATFDLGFAVAVDGDRAVSGAEVYTRTGTSWSLEGVLVPAEDGASGFGTALALQGDRILVGSDGARGSGLAWLFERGAAGWQPRLALAASAPSSAARFGTAVALDAGRALVGAPQQEVDGVGEAGAAYLYPLGTATFRTAGPNVASYVIEAPILGRTIRASVDLTTTGHDLALLFAFDAPAERVLAGGQVLLAAPRSRGALRITPGAVLDPFALLVGAGELLGLDPVAGPQATFDLPLPNDVTLCGRRIYTQAMHLGGIAPFVLSNARDLLVGY